MSHPSLGLFGRRTENRFLGPPGIRPGTGFSILSQRRTDDGEGRTLSETCREAGVRCVAARSVMSLQESNSTHSLPLSQWCMKHPDHPMTHNRQDSVPNISLRRQSSTIRDRFDARSLCTKSFSSRVYRMLPALSFQFTQTAYCTQASYVRPAKPDQLFRSFPILQMEPADICLFFKCRQPDSTP